MWGARGERKGVVCLGCGLFRAFIIRLVYNLQSVSANWRRHETTRLTELGGVSDFVLI